MQQFFKTGKSQTEKQKKRNKRKITSRNAPYLREHNIF